MTLATLSAWSWINWLMCTQTYWNITFVRCEQCSVFWCYSVNRQIGALCYINTAVAKHIVVETPPICMAVLSDSIHTFISDIIAAHLVDIWSCEGTHFFICLPHCITILFQVFLLFTLITSVTMLKKNHFFMTVIYLCVNFCFIDSTGECSDVWKILTNKCRFCLAYTWSKFELPLVVFSVFT